MVLIKCFCNYKCSPAPGKEQTLKGYVSKWARWLPLPWTPLKWGFTQPWLYLCAEYAWFLYMQKVFRGNLMCFFFPNCGGTFPSWLCRAKGELLLWGALAARGWPGAAGREVTPHLVLLQGFLPSDCANVLQNGGLQTKKLPESEVKAQKGVCPCLQDVLQADNCLLPSSCLQNQSFPVLSSIKFTLKSVEEFSRSAFKSTCVLVSPLP